MKQKIMKLNVKKNLGAAGRETRLSVAAKIAQGMCSSRAQHPLTYFEENAEKIAQASIKVADALIAKTLDK